MEQMMVDNATGIPLYMEPESGNTNDTNAFRRMTKIFDFIGQSKKAFLLSAVLIVLSIVGLCTKGLNYGIDFSGGILVEIKSEQKIDMSEMRKKVSALNLGETNLQSVGTTGDEMLIHVVVDTTDKAGQEKIIAQIKQALGGGIEYRRTEVVGPKVGADLFSKSIWAAIWALVAIAIYIWFRFEWQFSLACLLFSSCVHHSRLEKSLLRLLPSI